MDGGVLVPVLPAREISKKRRRPLALRHGDESRVARKGHQRPARRHLCACRTECTEMEQQTICKTCKYKPKPTPEQERLLDRTLTLGRQAFEAAIGERQEAWRMRGVRATHYQQKSERPGIKEAMPDDGEVHSHVLQDVVLRVDRAFQAFFQRVKNGEMPGYPRFHGRERYNSFTDPPGEKGARLDDGFLLLSKIGRIAVRWPRLMAGAPKTSTISKEADG